VNDPVTTHNSMVSGFGQNRVQISDNDGAQDIDAPTRRWKAWGLPHCGRPSVLLPLHAFLDGRRPVAGCGRRECATSVTCASSCRTFGVNLVGMTPSDSRVSSGWCFARPGDEYIVYLHNGGATR
jgi:hypothetical protein